MPDREKVIKGLTECVAAGLRKACPVDCPYLLQCFPDVGLATPFVSLMADALALLKEQDLDIEALKNTIQGMVEGQAIIAGDRRVDVVRCKHWSAERINDYNKCKRWINVGVKNFATMGDWFCADGERAVKWE